MARYGVAEAKNGLPALIDKALAGEEVVITRHGQAVVELRAVKSIPSMADKLAALERIAKLRDEIGPLGTSSLEIIREMREEYRY